MKSNKINIKTLLKRHNIKPNKVMGQNFLVDEGVVDQMIKAAEISSEDVVLEVGPGLGALTRKIAQKAKKIIAVEKDKKVAEILKENLGDLDNVEIVVGDILKIMGATGILGTVPAAGTVPNIPYKVVANIPYYLTSHLVRKLLESDNPPQTVVFLMQKEVAERICASPPKMTLLSVSVQIYSRPELLYDVPKQSFWPKPKVDSAVVKISDIRKPKDLDMKKFFRLVKAGFSRPRKQLANNLSERLKTDKEEIKKALIELGLDIQIRAERLTIEDWIKLLNRERIKKLRIGVEIVVD